MLINAADCIEHRHPTTADLLAAEFRARTLSSFREQSPTSISANCDKSFHARKTSGLRPLSVIDLNVIHSEESATAISAASWFENPRAQGSAHLCIDDNICYRTLDDDEIPWAAPGANYHGLHYEQAGFAGWARTIWETKHRQTIIRTAYKIAYHSRKYGIGVRWLSADQLRAGIRSGTTSHAECTKAFGGTHTDPGAGYPRRLLMTLVRAFYYTAFLREVR